MDPVGQLPPQDWMVAPATQAVVAALTAHGADVRFVGGCVRDAVLKRPIKDIDIVTHDPPERVMLLLETAGIRAIPTGIEHGTVTAVVDRAHFEITTLRTDVESFGRHARVAFTDDWAADAARRDFTINALFAGPDGRIFDPFDGLQDLGAGRVRFVGEPLQRIEEDVLRLLRFFRFYAWYGKPPPEPAAVAACRVMAPRLQSLSGERMCGEILRLLASPDPAAVLLLMHGERILVHVLPEAVDFGRLRVLSFLETRGLRRAGLDLDPLRRLAALLPPERAAARTVAERFNLSGQQAQRLAALTAPGAVPDPGLDEPARRHILRRVGAAIFRDLTLLAWAARKAVEARPQPGETESWISLLDSADRWVAVELPVRGRDVTALGVPQGPRVGQLLKAIEDWWEEEDYRPGRAECLARLEVLLAE